MDPKKQDLNPELKQIYDRIMNTQVKTPQTPTSPPAPPDPTAVSFHSQPGSFAPAGAGAQSAPTPVPAAPTPSEGFLSSVPPRPITETKPFVFTGNKVTTPEGQSTIHVPNMSGKQISGKVIALLVVVLIIAWAVFWSKFFGLF